MKTVSCYCLSNLGIAQLANKQKLFESVILSENFRNLVDLPKLFSENLSIIKTLEHFLTIPHPFI